MISDDQFNKLPYSKKRLRLDLDSRVGGCDPSMRPGKFNRRRKGRDGGFPLLKLPQQSKS